MADEDPFEWVRGRSLKVQCKVCGAKGYGDVNPVSNDARALGWQKKCLEGHPFRCSCGRYFATGQGFANHMRLMRDGQRHVPWEEVADVWTKWVMTDA